LIDERVLELLHHHGDRVGHGEHHEQCQQHPVSDPTPGLGSDRLVQHDGGVDTR